MFVDIILRWCFLSGEISFQVLRILGFVKHNSNYWELTVTCESYETLTCLDEKPVRLASCPTCEKC